MTAPTLLVGLGGTGSSIVQQVYARATEKQRETIGFVIFDTDVNELRIIEEQTPRIRTIQTSTKLTVGEYLDIDTFARDTWFPVNRILNGKALTEGAGQVRAISRLALDTAIQQGKMSPLNEAIEDLYKLTGQKSEQAPRVILVGSLCGGTGSGLILPVSMYIRNFMTSKLQHGTTNIRGFFLLPEVFDGVIKTQSERNNLRSNAYAAVREINAFMLKDAGTLSEKYNPHFFAPRAGSRELDEYTGSPMDFCFLFDAQNLNGQKLNSFQEYKEHAANCIYGMAIAPTSKRSNSSEDNVIREIISSGGKNRFAGAGTSMLIYPTDDVEKYLALQWTKTSISSDWLRIDKRFELERESVRQRRAQGVQVQELDRGEHYVRIVNEGDAEDDIFAKTIRSMCIQYGRNGIKEEGDKWVKYIDALKTYINDSITAEKLNFDEIIKDISLAETGAAESKVEEAEEKYRDWYSQLISYRNATRTAAKNLAMNIGYQLFKDPTDFTKDTDHKYRMEYWLHDMMNGKSFIHPNAARYFLYNTLKILKEDYRNLEANVDEILEYWVSFEEETFDIKETDEKETEADYYDKVHFNDSRIQRLIHTKQIKGAIANLNSSFQTYGMQIDEYWQSYVTASVFDFAIKYVELLDKSFESFYDVLGRYIPTLDKHMGLLEQKYEYKKGEALRYVCADKQCLEGLASDVKNPNNALSLPSDLNRSIFAAMKAYAVADKKPDADDYFRDVFDSTVTDYLKSEIRSNFKSIVRMDILSALEREASYRGGENAKDTKLYAKHVMEAASRLATPFIESPAGEEARIIPACAYSPSLFNDDIPGREAFIRKNLMDNGGEADDSIDDNMILYYQAVYKLAASDLSKFAPPRNRETFERPGGEYYKAYYELVLQLNPDTTRSKVITPHIDRLWHVVTELPDLDDASQEMQEKRIFRAFFWGIIGGYIKYKERERNHYVYYANKMYLNLKAKDGIDALIVSNGTPCDHLYEVLDAFTIYPRLVQLVNSAVKTRIDNDLYSKRGLEKSVLFEYLNSFTVQERILDTDADYAIKRSIFDIPMLMKWSVPPEEYHEESMEGLLNTIMEEIKLYLSRFTEENELNVTYANLLIDQFDLFLKNMQIEREAIPRVFEDPLLIEIADTLKVELRALDMNEEAKAIEQKVLELRRNNNN